MSRLIGQYDSLLVQRLPPQPTAGTYSGDKNPQTQLQQRMLSRVAKPPLHTPRVENLKIPVLADPKTTKYFRFVGELGGMNSKIEIDQAVVNMALKRAYATYPELEDAAWFDKALGMEENVKAADLVKGAHAHAKFWRDLMEESRLFWRDVRTDR